LAGTRGFLFIFLLFLFTEFRNRQQMPHICIYQKEKRLSGAAD